MKIGYHIVEQWLLFLAIGAFLGYREAFPATLVGSDACKLKEFQLNTPTVFLSASRSILTSFWESEYAPVCHEEQDKEEQHKPHEDVVDDDSSSNAQEEEEEDDVVDWIGDAVEWTASFASFSNTVVEDTVLSAIPPFFANKVRSVTDTVAESWNTTEMKMMAHSFWTGRVEPRIPVKVKAAWDDAFAAASAPSEESKANITITETIAANTTTTTATQEDEDPLEFDLGSAALSLVRFCVASATPRFSSLGDLASAMTALENAKQWLGNLATSIAAEIVAWFHYCSYTIKVFRSEYPGLFFWCLIVPIIIGLYFCAYQVGQWVDAQFLEPRREEELRQFLREREEQRRELRRQQHQQEWSHFLCYVEFTERTEPGQLCNILASTARQFLPNDPHFKLYKAYIDSSDPESRSIWVVLGLLSWSLHALRPARFTEDEVAICRRLFNRANEVVYATRAESDWTDLKELCRFAEEKSRAGHPIDFRPLVVMLSRSLPSVRHFESFREFYVDHGLHQLKKLWVNLNKALHRDRTQHVFSEQEHLSICDEALKLINGAWEKKKSET